MHRLCKIKPSNTLKLVNVYPAKSIHVLESLIIQFRRFVDFQLNFKYVKSFFLFYRTKNKLKSTILEGNLKFVMKIERYFPKSTLRHYDSSRTKSKLRWLCPYCKVCEVPEQVIHRKKRWSILPIRYLSLMEECCFIFFTPKTNVGTCAQLNVTQIGWRSKDHEE